MGTDAIVFYNEKRFANHPLRQFFNLDEDTGELYPKTLDFKTNDLGEIEAMSLRLGNYSHLNRLMNLLCPILPEDSIIISNILYRSLTVPVGEIERLKEEVILIQRNSMSVIKKDLDVEDFVSKLTDLIRIAEREKNPIVIT